MKYLFDKKKWFSKRRLKEMRINNRSYRFLLFPLFLLCKIIKNSFFLSKFVSTNHRFLVIGMPIQNREESLLSEWLSH